MATVKKGILTTSPEWWKHLKWAKKTFWNVEREAAKKMIKKEIEDN